MRLAWKGFGKLEVLVVEFNVDKEGSWRIHQWPRPAAPEHSRLVQPWAPPGMPGSAGPQRNPEARPPDHLRPVIEQLLTGATDTTASQRLGLSPRTFSRRVSELLDNLRAESRFQAGVEAARRGWLPRDTGRRPGLIRPGTRDGGFESGGRPPQRNGGVQPGGVPRQRGMLPYHPGHRPSPGGPPSH